MAPQVASLSELSRIRGDAEVRYPYAITQPELSAPGLAQAGRQQWVGRGAEEREEGGGDRHETGHSKVMNCL